MTQNKQKETAGSQPKATQDDSMPERAGTVTLPADAELSAACGSPLSDWLEESKFLATLIADINESLLFLAAKRVTLEEKTIASYYNKLLSRYGILLSALHARLAEKGVLPADTTLERVRSLDLKVHQATHQLLKALRYSFNYVEQYFEYDFCARLTHDSGFLEEIDEIIDSFV